MGIPLKFSYDQRTDNHSLHKLQVSEMISIDSLYPFSVGPAVNNTQLGTLLCFRVVLFTEWTTLSVRYTPAHSNSE